MVLGTFAKTKVPPPVGSFNRRMSGQGNPTKALNIHIKCLFLLIAL
jgi:hypothetical protein